MEINHPDRLLEDGFSALPENIQSVLRKVEGMPGDPAQNMLRREGFTDIRPEAYQKGRGVYTNKDTPGVVYKIGVDHNAWQNNIEKTIWEEQEHPSFSGRISDGVLECLTPVLESHDTNDDCHWLIMPKAEMGVATKEQGISLMEKMLETDWVVTDHHRGNIGRWRGQTLFVDYGQLKPKRYLMDDWREAMESYDWGRAYKGGISVNSNLAHKLSTAISDAKGTKKVLEYTLDSTEGKEEVQVTGYGVDTPDETGEIATTLMLSVTKESSSSVEVFNRLVMVDTPEMRQKAEEMAKSFGGRVDFGPSHFENPGDYIAAHLTLGKVSEMSELTERLNETVDLYEESIEVSE